MKKFGELLRRLKAVEVQTQNIESTQDNSTKSSGSVSNPLTFEEVNIKLDGNIEISEQERHDIIEGAKQLLAQGESCEIVDAIFTSVILFGKFRPETQIDKNGKITVVLKSIEKNNIKKVSGTKIVHTVNKNFNKDVSNQAR